MPRIFGLVLLLVARTPAYGQEDRDGPTVDAAPVADGSVVEAPAPAEGAAADVQAMAAAVRGLLQGTLPDAFSLEELFVVDLGDEDAIARRREELRVEADALRAEAAGAPPDAVRRTQARLALTEARLSWLDQPEEARRRLEEADLARRLARQEVEAAEQARLTAETEVEAAREAQERALAEARMAGDQAMRDLSTERARLERIRAEIATRRGEIASRDAGAIAEGTARLDEAFALETRANQVQVGRPAVKGLLTEVDAAAERARDTLTAALADLEGLARPPSYAPDPALLANELVPESDREALREEARKLEQEAADLAIREREAAFARARAAAELEERLNRLRVGLLGKLPMEARRQRTRILAQGAEEIGIEARRLGMRGRWAGARFSEFRAHPGETLLDVGTLLTGVWGLVWLGVLVGVGVVGARRGPGWLQRLSDALLTTSWNPVVVRIGRAVLEAIRGVFSKLLVVVVVALVGWVLADALENPVLAFLYEVCWAVAVFRLVLDLAHRGVVWAAVARSGATSPQWGERLLGSMRRLGILVLVWIILFRACETAFGTGMLLGLANRVLGILAFLLVWREMARWRSAIADAYLASWPQGRFANAVRASRDRAVGALVALVAVAAVGASTVAAAGRRFAMGFEQSRRLMALLFRHKARRTADVGAASPSTLPPDLAGAFQPGPVDEAPWRVDRLPGRDRVDAAVDCWRKGGRATLLAAGLPGSGRTSWLRAVARRIGDGSAQFLTPPRRLHSARDAVSWLSTALGLPEEGSPEAVAAHLSAGPPQALLLDGFDRFVLRGDGAADAWRGLAAVVHHSGPAVLWMATACAPLARYGAWAGRADWPFSEVVRLKPWTEEEIAELLELRVRACGYEVTYDRPLAGTQRFVASRAEFLRLVWDHANGSPAVALHAWRLALVPCEGRRLELRLFQEPDLGVLEALTDIGAFALAAVAWHGGLDPTTAARVLRLPRVATERTLGHLADVGVLEPEPDEPEALRIAVPWIAAVYRYLARKHLVESA
ncbi:MAG: hypothetical protein JXB39_16955 [Deltaproteobacteria bacterium]|nr:hypothetical protein [Deltaproteobacteria bacterium]